jgi:tetrahydromethanopterin S-methyltransferase subunit E
MVPQLGIRFWLESTAAGLAAGLGILTVFWKGWIEAVFGVDPDHRSGALEWQIVVALFAVALLLGWTARLEWRGRRRLDIGRPGAPPAT